ncbi:MAG: hypothetical protein BWZ10_02749 [candidate division BRC1 bacterium ADurb.BinA364]|nr:MAG: hypothetical protein BWZ10_02749 [candidate division BRC1 bacterium ADurb.BinA364]
MQTRERAHRANLAGKARFQRPDEFAIEHRPDQRGGGVAQADQIRSGLDLRPCELQFHFEDKRKQIAHELRIVVEIQHQIVDSPQIGALGARPFDPAFDQQILANPLAQQRHALNSVVHAPASKRIGALQRKQSFLIRQQRIGLVDRRRLVVVQLDFRSAIGGFARRIGNRRDIVESERFGCGDLPIGQRAMVHRIAAIRNADPVGGEHHGDRHQRQPVGAFSIQQSPNSLLSIHGASP